MFREEVFVPTLQMLKLQLQLVVRGEEAMVLMLHVQHLLFHLIPFLQQVLMLPLQMLVRSTGAVS